jgi:hypothetical protein
MTDEEFRELLDRHGGNLDDWPRATAREARLLLARSVSAQAMLDEMVATELALADPDISPPPDLADRIFEAAFGTASAGSSPTAERSDKAGKPHRLM